MEKTLYMLQIVLEDAIKQIVRKEDITPTELDNVTKALCAIEQIKRIEGEGEYSERSYNSRSRRYEGDDNYSYRRGRDSMGRFTSRGSHEGGSNDSMSNSHRYNDASGYSGHSIRDRMIDKLEQMMDSAKSEHERRTIEEWINRLDTEKR